MRRTAKVDKTTSGSARGNFWGVQSQNMLPAFVLLMAEDFGLTLDQRGVVS